MKANNKFLIALSHFPKFGTSRIKKLEAYFPNWQQAFEANLPDLVKSGLDENLGSEFIASRKNIDPDLLTGRMEKENIKIITIHDPDYPPLLKEIYDPPYLLYYKGRIKEHDNFNIAVVGTRKFSHYGEQVTTRIVSELAQNSITITSGLALGIDSLAHNSALGVAGRTIGVLGTGINYTNIYPTSNRYLAEKIVSAGGLILSEFPLDTPPLRHNFPLRNRIISGLALGTLVIEAGEKSGALITAHSALDQNREVFAVPGSILSPVSVGPNNLIKQGARPVTCAQEILEALDLMQVTTFVENKKIIPSTPEEEKIITCLDFEPTHINEIIRKTGLNTAKASSTLSLMEMKGMIKNIGNMQYVRKR